LDLSLSGTFRAGNNRRLRIRANRIVVGSLDLGRLSADHAATGVSRDFFFGVASFKPQLGILIPVALVSARLWRTFAAACGTIAVLVLASSMAFGWSLWPSWGEKLFSHANWVANVKDRYNPTISASLTFIGIDLAAARIVQLAVAAGVAVIVWVCFRRGVTALAVAALLAGTFLATPYAVVYDLPMLTSAIVVLLAERSRTETNPTLVEALILALALVLPIIILETWRLSALKSLPLLLLFGLIVRKIFHSRSVKPEVRPSLY
jgi:Glycosyltransferase family 87